MTLEQEQCGLRGAEGDLVLLRITVGARQLEELLETIASLPFPINPEIQHQASGLNCVEFPAYSSRIEEVRLALTRRGFAGLGFETVAKVLGQ